MSRPLVSVVTSVYNAGKYLRPSMGSVLRQDEVDLEVVVVDDGSTDGSSGVLEELAAVDSRVRLIRQGNRGLTAALVRGCSEARGEFIARHDSDDLSLPGRLAKQSQCLREAHDLAMVSCWGRAIGPEDETLLEIVRPEDTEIATRELVSGENGPPGHGSVMFRSGDYRHVGGYRTEFRYAQDWDLWLRLVELGRIAYVPEFLYAFRVLEQSISARSRNRQDEFVLLARLCRGARAKDEPESELLAAARTASLAPSPGHAPRGGSYFIGKCLYDRRDRRALLYLWRSVTQSPWNLRMWVALVAAALLCRGRT